jgi:hypothetical protein
MKIYYGSTDTLNNYETNTNLDLKVIGSFRENYRNQLVVSCSNCNDKELYRTCLFQTTERQYLKGMQPCGCAKAVYWEDWQAELILHRRASFFRYSFLGWEGDYRGSLSRTKFNCSKHRSWNGSNMNDCRRYDIVCPGCWSDKMSVINRKPDEDMIKNFFSTGQFHPETTFLRSDKLTRKGYREYWDVFCPDCSTSYVANYKKLSEGYRGCECSGFRQKELYLNTVRSGDIIIALKFGVANNSTLRLKSISRRTPLEVKQYCVWEFDSVMDCKDAELTIKHSFRTGVIDKGLLPDGYTETLSVLDIDKLCVFLDARARRKS